MLPREKRRRKGSGAPSYCRAAYEEGSHPGAKPVHKCPHDPVLAALSDIQISLGDMSSRIAVLEAGASRDPVPTFSRFVGAPAASDRDVEPRRSLASAVPAAASGVPFLSPAAGVSVQLRS